MSNHPQEAVSSGSAVGGEAISVIAPAKINLFLHVVGHRPDGYHLIQSLFAFASFGDQLTISADSDLKFELDGPFSHDLGGGINLVLRAARALAQSANLDGPGAKLQLRKNLPVAAGVGGGSADAAAALHALRKHWSVGLTNEDILALALELGADVPACYVGRPMIVNGIGEQLTPYDNLPRIPLLLVSPGQELSTREVFDAYRQQSPKFTSQIPDTSLTAEVDVWDLLSRTQNDLQFVAIQMAPQVDNCLQAISDTPNCRLARMSGSGASCFGLYDSQHSVRSAAVEIKSRNPDWWIQTGHLQASLEVGNE